MMHVQGDVDVPFLEQMLTRMQEIEMSQDVIEEKREQAEWQLLMLEGTLIGDVVAMLPDEYQQMIFECYNVNLRLLE